MDENDIIERTTTSHQDAATLRWVHGANALPHKADKKNAYPSKHFDLSTTIVKKVVKLKVSLHTPLRVHNRQILVVRHRHDTLATLNGWTDPVGTHRGMVC